MASEYTCALCGLVFESAWTDEAAMSETREVFGTETRQEDCDVVCDDCFKKIDPRQFEVV